MLRALFVAACIAGAAANPAAPFLIKLRERQLKQQREAAKALWGSAAPPADQYFTQRLDHYDGLQLATWQQRFWVRAWPPASPGVSDWPTTCDLRNGGVGS